MKAFITGITGQDGAYLSQHLLSLGYEVHGLVRYNSRAFNTEKLTYLGVHQDVHLHIGDITDPLRIQKLLADIKPDEIYNLAGLSHVHVSFDNPKLALDTIAYGALNLLEVSRNLGLEKTCKFFQASTSELYGNANQSDLLNEASIMQPVSPYGSAKLYAYHLTQNYRQAYGFHISNGICFNHESPIRSPVFVTRKITCAVAAIKKGKEQCLYLGNLDAQRDWGHAKDFVVMMHKMLQQDHGDDYVIATGMTYTIRDFVNRAFSCAGIEIIWQGTGLTEKAVDKETGKTVVAIDPQYRRPNELHYLIGDASKATERLGWQGHKFDLTTLIEEMVLSDLKLLT